MHSSNLCNLRKIIPMSIWCVILSFTISWQSKHLSAEPLSAEKCLKLKGELKALKQTEAIKAMAKGFEWVKTNLNEEERLPILRFLTVSEDLKFKCKNPKKPVKKKVVKVRIALPKKKRGEKPLKQQKSTKQEQQPKAEKVRKKAPKKPVKKKSKPKKKNAKAPKQEETLNILEALFGPDEQEAKNPKKVAKKKSKKTN